MSKAGIKAAPDQAAVYKVLIGDDSKLNDNSVEAAQFVIETTAKLWDTLKAKYGDSTEEVVSSGTGGRCKTLADIIVHGETELLKEMVG